MRHNDRETAEPDSTEVQFALVIARMIDTVNSSPEDMRQAVYDLTRYKLQEQFTHADVTDVKRAQHALEAAIPGVEKFSATQQASLPPPAVSDEGRERFDICRHRASRQLPRHGHRPRWR